MHVLETIRYPKPLLSGLELMLSTLLQGFLINWLDLARRALPEGVIDASRRGAQSRETYPAS